MAAIAATAAPTATAQADDAIAAGGLTISLAADFKGDLGEGEAGATR